jgi:hsp70-interacting protein
MQSLLRWSIENSSPQDGAEGNAPLANRTALDPGIIDAILGKPDAELMKEDLAVALDFSRSEDNRVDALDHLEMVPSFLSPCVRVEVSLGCCSITVN